VELRAFKPLSGGFVKIAEGEFRQKLRLWRVCKPWVQATLDEAGTKQLSVYVQICIGFGDRLKMSQKKQLRFFYTIRRILGDKNGKSRYNRAQSGKPTMFCISMSTTTMMTMTLNQEPLLRARW